MISGFETFPLHALNELNGCSAANSLHVLEAALHVALLCPRPFRLSMLVMSCQAQSNLRLTHALKTYCS